MDLDLFKLEKLKISAYSEVGRDGAPTVEFEAMFNPASYSQTYAIVWGTKQGVNASGKELEYSRSAPSELTLDLVLDGTGVDEMGIFAIGRKSVSDRVKEFLDVTYTYDGALHQSNYLVVTWGDLVFSCRLSTVTVNYTSFDRDGTPLRAELRVQLVSDESAKSRAQKDQKNSPDLTHARVVRSGDTLPLLTKEIYGSSTCYLEVARFNGLDDFRNLAPGQKLFFPPLVQLGGGASGRR